jgi:Protein ENHANCED DISEASE RESISTANCE 2, C-terminal
MRLKMIPSVVDGPLAVRVLAPPKREICVSCALLPVSWRSYEAEVDAATGRKLAPTLEITLDCTSNRAMRSMAGILKRNLQSLAIDVAIVIQKPDEKDEDEPQACLAMWRFNHIDVSKCPTFPDRFEYEAKVHMAQETTSPLHHPDVMRASKIVLISTEELEVLAAMQ